MKRLMTLFSVLIVAGLLAGCYPIGISSRVVRGSGRLETREMDLKGFSRVEAGYASTIEIVQGASFSTSITTDDNLWDYLEATVSGDMLRLRLRSGYSYNNMTLRVRITMPELRGLNLSGASRGTVTGFKSAADLESEISGASSLQGDIAAGNLRLIISGASTATLKGSAKDLRIEGSGASSTRFGDLTVQNADVRLSGASSAILNMSGRLDADLSGASRVQYSGSVTLGSIHTSGGSSINSK